MNELSRGPGGVLVVEDDFDIRSTLEAALTDEGYDVATASNGQAALDHLRSCSKLPFVILLDLRMPVMDGHDFLATRSSEAALAAIPAIVLTADHTRKYVLGAHLVLPKPFALGRLLEEMARLR